MVLNKCVESVVNEQTKIQVTSQMTKARPSREGKEGRVDPVSGSRSGGRVLGATQGAWGAGVWSLGCILSLGFRKGTCGPDSHLFLWSQPRVCAPLCHPHSSMEVSLACTRFHESIKVEKFNVWVKCMSGIPVKIILTSGHPDQVQEEGGHAGLLKIH